MFKNIKHGSLMSYPQHNIAAGDLKYNYHPPSLGGQTHPFALA